MSQHFFPVIKKWPLAVQKALLKLNDASLSGETRIVDFQLGPPQHGELPLRLFLDGRRALMFLLNDTSLSFLQNVRDWMERCLVFDWEGILHPELLTLDCSGTVVCFAMVHIGWDEVDSRSKPISYFVAIQPDRDEPVLCCICDTLDTLGGLYRAILECLKRYRALFESNECWYDPKRLDKLTPSATTDRMLSQIRSRKLEIKLLSGADSHHFRRD